jgi:hypothetical protein
MPGTATVDGVGPFEMTPRSVIGVNEFAPASKPGSGVPSANVVIELFAGVVNGLLVVKSVLWKQVASASWSPNALRMCSQRVSA